MGAGGVEIREYRKAIRCEHRGVIRRCRQPLVGQCQYCARGFCERHGRIHDDGQEICIVSRCEQLRIDVELHLVFKAAAQERNQKQICGEPGCSQPHTLLCERCTRRYCEGHLRQVIMTVPRGGELQTEAVAMCDHCRDRLALWAEE